MSSRETTTVPGWQRLVCGLLAVGVLLPLAFMLSALLDATQPVSRVLSVLLPTLFGGYLFAFVAIRGRLPFFFQRSSSSDRQV